ncbi:DNA polymerase theta-like [Portunus trituberculatus]|uniref:DNA polymerase theta-like n=1 Tax=Portunus trituberculatus TaxID=210409 RepID=UPI001E1CF2CA|nr:DNA polymerase theta-like [Portunus trituberculatus]XP_045135229.1 DNA polymerase theta-like [Portunus trituberculatus]
MSRDQSSKADPWGLRRSPRIRMLQLNTQKHDANVGGNTARGPVEDTRNDRRQRNSDLLESFGTSTQEAMDAMDLDDSIFHKVSVSQLRTEELGNQRKPKHDDASSQQTNCQIPHRLQCQKSRNSKDECAKESLCLVRSREDIMTYSSGNGNTPEQDNGLCENKRALVKEERKTECSMKMLKDDLIHSMESPVSASHKHHKETCTKKNNFKETNIQNKQCLQGLGKPHTTSRKYNKENIHDFDSNHKRIIHSRGTEKDQPLLKRLQENQSPSSSHNQPKPTKHHASPKRCSMENILPILKSSAFYSQSHSLTNNSEACKNIVKEQELQKEPDNAVSVKEILHEKQDCVRDHSTSPDDCKKTVASHDSMNKIDITVLKSPLNSDDSRSFLSTQEKMELSAWGLPESVLKCYLENGVKRMFPWQAECLSLPGVLEGRNLIYSAPTSAGKTLVAELLLLKRILEGGCKGIYILPFVSVAREKMLYMQKMFGSVGVRVEGFMGSQGPSGGLKVTDIAVCTIEKANNLINRLLENHRVNELGIIVVDELHMVGDSHRGYLLELLLTKLTYVTSSMSSAESPHSLENKVCGKPIQIVGMSATLPNLELLAAWLDAALYTTDFRPVPLQECVKLGTSVYDSSFKKIRELCPKMTMKGDRDHLMQLCLETVLEGFSVLVFCPSKAWCENLAEAVAKEFYDIGKTDSSYPPELGPRLRSALDPAGIRNVLEALRKSPVRLDKILSRSVAFGVAYHHAGLTFDERDIIEGGFRSGSLRVLLATSTLSSGVNLPARRVIIRSPVFGGSILDVLTYKQMVGRAGRKGVDMKGESILICREGEKEKAKTLMTSSLPPITSCLQKDASLTSSMKRAVLEVIVSGVAKTPQEVEKYCSCTLLAASLRAGQLEEKQGNDLSHTQSSLKSCIDFLLENEFIRLQGEEEEEGSVQHVGTQLGLAVLASGLSPDEGLHVFSELHRARKCFVLENELHIVYQVTPVYVSAAWPDLDWLSFLRVWEALSEDQKRVAQLVGVEESFIVRALKGVINKRVRRQAQQLAVHQRFYASLALQDLVQEVPLDEVAHKFGASRGVLQALQQSASTFAGMVTVFCNRLGWHNLELLVAQFRDRLQFGIQRDLCDLMQLSPLLNAQRARHVHSAGLETVAMVANATPTQVEQILHAATPFHSTKLNEKATQGTIWLSSDQCVTEAEAATLIVAEARKLVQKELGISSIDWNQRMQDPIKPIKTHHSPGTPLMIRKELVTFLMTSETPHSGKALLKQQVFSSNTVSTHTERTASKYPRLKGDWKELLKKCNEKKENFNKVVNKTVEKNVCNHQISNEDDSRSAVSLEAASTMSVGRKFAEVKELQLVDNPTISTKDENAMKKKSTESSEKSINREPESVVISRTENRLYDNALMSDKKVNSHLKLNVIDVEKSDIPGKLMDAGNNRSDSKIAPKRNSTRIATRPTCLLLSNISTKKKVKTKNNKNKSIFTPDSQEDKSDNVFSPKSRKARSNTSHIPKAKGEKVTSWSALPIGDINTSSTINKNNCKTQEVPRMLNFMMKEGGKENPPDQNLGSGTDIASVGRIIGVGSGEDSNTTLPHTPVMSGRIRMIASSTPIMVSESQTNKPLPCLLTPGPAPASSSVLNFMVNTDLNNSSDLFSESNSEFHLANKTQDASSNIEELQEKNYETDSCEVGILDHKKEQYRKEKEDIPNLIKLESTKDNSECKDKISKDLMCLKLNNVNTKRPCIVEDKMCFSDHQRPSGVNGTVRESSSDIKDNGTRKFTESSHEYLEDYVLTDSQKNGLLMTMSSQKPDDPAVSPMCHTKLDNVGNMKNYEVNCCKSSLDSHKELGNGKIGKFDVPIDSGVNRMSVNELPEQCDSIRYFGKGEKRKLVQGAEPGVLTKRLCVSPQKSKTENVKDSVSHATLKADWLSNPTEIPGKTEDDFGSLSFFEKSTSIDLYINEDQLNVENKNENNILIDTSNQEDFFNQALLNLSEISNNSNNSSLTLEKFSDRKNILQPVKEIISVPKDLGSVAYKDYVSDSFQEEAYENYLQSQNNDNDTEMNSSKQLPQDDMELHHSLVKPLSQDFQLSMWDDSLAQSNSNITKHQNDSSKQKVNEMRIPDIENTRNLLHCTAKPNILHNREETAGESQKNLALHSDKSQQDVTFSQLQITPRTEALLEGKSFRDNNRGGEISTNFLLSPLQETQRQFNEVVEDKRTGKPEQCQETTNGVEEVNGLNIHQSSQLKTEIGSRLSSSTTDSLTCSTSSFCIVDVVNNRRVFESFVEELQQQSVVSLALACERAPSNKQQQEQCIGWRITGRNRTPRQRVQRMTEQQVAGVLVENSDLMLVGLAVCWGEQDAYYLNFRTSQDEPTSCSLPTPDLADAVPVEERVATVKSFLSRKRQCVVRVWDAKSSIRLMVGAGLGCLTGRVEDPRVAAWMLDPGAKEPNLCNLVMNHHLGSLPLLEGMSGCRGLGGLGTTISNPGSCRVRAAVESVIVFHLMPSLTSTLEKLEMLSSFVEVEMRSVVELAYMELSGLGFSNKECETQKCIMQAKLSSLENEAYSLVGHSFSLTSPVEISKVLYSELHLPQPSSRGSSIASNTRRRGRGRGGGPTNKESLEKLRLYHPLPDVILQWRKIYSSLTKVVLPLQQMKLRCSQLAMDRIHPVSHTFTSTGRITMHEPSLQTIPRDFDIQVTVEETNGNSKKKSLPQNQLNAATMSHLAPFLVQESKMEKQQQHTVSLRHAFVARPGHVLLAADYSQLELRLFAHLADDQPLLQLLNSGGDVFTLLATHLASQPSEVTPEQRQQAKQVCYGMIYGMGARALGEQLGIEEEEAYILMEQFKSSFPGLQRFAKTTVETARCNGYVTTLLGRRRYLPAITSTCHQSRAQSERQAVNTAIQGSAADLVKKAMVEIQMVLRETFPTAPTCLNASVLCTCQEMSRGAHLVLNLHDELMYEVMSEDVIQVAQLVQKHMEGAIQLSVALPVKLKVGPSWGSMQTLNL